MPRSDVILWIDLETTGSSDAADIIEFGGLLTDSTPELKELGRFTTLVDNSLDYESNAVVEMHKKSGLTADLQGDNVPSLGDAEKSILRWINDTVGFSTDHIPWGGSGVGHFDAKYIRRDWPFLSKRITYWVYDVGVMRRMLRLIGVEIPKENIEVKTHRALDDILQHVEETRIYLSLISDWKQTHETI